MTWTFQKLNTWSVDATEPPYQAFEWVNLRRYGLKSMKVQTGEKGKEGLVHLKHG